MGNFSRNTFDPAKRYVAVRLQQGVPLVDADWNEMNDVVRHELYEGLAACFPNVVARFENLKVTSFTSRENELQLDPGSALVAGRPVRLLNPIIYSEQPWTDSGRAAQDGVDAIPPLTTPTESRTDIAYLDVWEREVASGEDPNLINPVIGLETCTRLKREIALRVAEGKTSIPTSPSGHFYMPLALLHRPANQAVIRAVHIQDIRPTREISFFPAFWSLEKNDPWEISGSVARYKLNEDMQDILIGILPLVLPDAATTTHLLLKCSIYSVGNVEGRRIVLLFDFNRQKHNSLLARDIKIIRRYPVISETMRPALGGKYEEFDVVMQIPTIIDNNNYYYFLAVRARTDTGVGTPSISIGGISLRYQF